MDEPTAALGVTQTRVVLDLIQPLKPGIAVIVISHNLNDVFQVADRVAVLCLGRLVSVGPAPSTTPQSDRRPDDHRPPSTGPASRAGSPRIPAAAAGRMSGDYPRSST